MKRSDYERRRQRGYEKIHRQRKQEEGVCIRHGCWEFADQGKTLCREHVKAKYHRARNKKGVQKRASAQKTS